MAVYIKKEKLYWELFEKCCLDNLFSTNESLVILYSIRDALYFIKKRICLGVKGGFLNVHSPSLRLEDGLSQRLSDAIIVTTPNGIALSTVNILRILGLLELKSQGRSPASI